MNATAMAPKISARLDPIKTVSRIVRFVILGILAFTIGHFIVCFMIWVPPSWYNLKFSLPGEIILWLWYWNLSRLFHFYERGLIFAKETIRCIRLLGRLCIVGWLFTYISQAWIRFVPERGEALPLPKHVAENITIVYAPSHALEPIFKMGFFNFSIAGISFGLLLGGIIIVVIAWIMDEGRKIQEEQELTV